MSRIITSVGLLLAMSLSLQAEWLAWSVDFTDGTPWGSGTAPTTAWLTYRTADGTGTAYYFDAVNGLSVLANGGASYAGLDMSEKWVGEKGEVWNFKANLGTSDTPAIPSSLLKDNSSYQFYIELGNYTSGSSRELMWFSEGLTYEQVSGAIYADDMAIGSVSSFVMTASNASVPEPKSWLLMVVGMGLLGLSRRRPGLVPVRV